MDKKILIVVDVQPSYVNEKYSDIIEPTIEHINKHIKAKNPVFAFFNTEEFSGDSADDSKYFFLEKGMKEKAWASINFIEKEYGFLRNWMDEAVADETIHEAVKIMKEKDIHDSRMFSEDDWQRIAQTGETRFEDEDLRESIIVHSPYFDLNIIKGIKNTNVPVEIIGGGRYECLEEMKLFLEAYDIEVTVNEDLCYGAEAYTPEHKKEGSKFRL